MDAQLFHLNNKVNFLKIIFKLILFSPFQTLFDPYFVSLYNVLYTSLPVLVIGIFDQVSFLE